MTQEKDQKSRRKRRFLFFFAKTLAIVLLFFFSATVAYAKATPIKEAVDKVVKTITKPKPIIQSDKTLPLEVQNAIEELANQQIKEEQRQATLPFTETEVGQESPLAAVFENISLTLNQDSIDRAKTRIKKNNRLISKLQRSLSQNASTRSVDKAVKLIKEIGQETDKIVADPRTQVDREILTLQIQQYNRLLLILQQLEDTLSFNDYLKIEDARQKYLVATAVNALNSAPSLEAIHSIALPVVSSFVGEDFAELKAIEITTDFEENLKPEAKEKLHSLQKDLVADFEKRMLKLPPNLRNRKLQSYIHYSFGDPLLQTEAFEHMRILLTDTSLISSIEGLREVAVKRLSDRLSELDNQQDIDSYLGKADKKAIAPTEFSLKEKQKLEKHLLYNVNDPEIFAKYEEFLLKNGGTSQSIKAKSALIRKVDLAEKQQLYEVMQQITQSIFTGHGAEFEKQLPKGVRNQIQELKRSLPPRNVPKFALPEGITLQSMAILPKDVQHSIVQAAKMRIRDDQKTEEIKLDLTLTAKGLDISEQQILPDNPFYFIKYLARRAQLLLTFDPLQRVELLVRHNNERTFEAAKLLEKSGSRKNVDLALKTLLEIEKDFARLKANAKNLNTLKQKAPQRVDGLINSIIKNGLARQTIFASIEDKVYSADYVKVERIRQQVLQDGIDSLLQLSGGDAQLLVEKLEQAVVSKEGSKFKELKAIELLIEIRRFQPEKIDEILQASEIPLIKNFEAKLLEIEKTEREKLLVAYAASIPGNPVRQFEAYEELISNFDSNETIELVQKLESKAVENFADLIESITDQNTLEEFATDVIGNQPEDLEIVIEIELGLESSNNSAIQTPLEQKIENVKTIVEEEVAEAIVKSSQEGQGPLTETEAKEIVKSIEEEITQEVREEPELIEEITQDLTNTTDEQILLEETIEEIQEEILSPSAGNTTPPVETLPEEIQEEIEEIIADVPTEQIIQTQVSTGTAIVTVEQVQATTTELVPNIEAPPPIPAPVTPSMPGL